MLLSLRECYGIIKIGRIPKWKFYLSLVETTVYELLLYDRESCLSITLPSIIVFPSEDRVNVKVPG